MSNKEFDLSKLSRRDWLKLVAIGVLGAGGVGSISIGLERFLSSDIEPPENVDLPENIIRTIPPDTTSERSESIFTPDTQEQVSTPIRKTPEVTPEPTPTPFKLEFNSDTDTKIGDISLTKPFVMEVPYDTALTAGFGTLRYEVHPWFMMGKTWDDELNAEGVNEYNHFYLGTEDALVTLVTNHGNPIRNTFVLMLHSYGYGNELLSGDWGRRAVENHLNQEPNRDIIGKPINFYQENAAAQELIAYNATIIPAETFNTSFSYWTDQNYPMVCNLDELGIPNLDENQIHIIACEGSIGDISANRYVLSFEAPGLAAIWAKYIFGRA